MKLDRRRFLVTLSATVPVARFLMTPAHAQAATASDGAFSQVSTVILGRKDFSPAVAERIETLLGKRIDGFDGKLADLGKALSGATDRDAALDGLNEDQTALALAIAKPWYLGYVGTPSGMIMNDDDAEFVTYLDADAYEVVLADLPRPSYPPAGRGWWQEVPKDVTAPAMPKQVTDWYWQPERATGKLATPDAAWKAYALGEYDTLDAARAALGSKPAADTDTPPINL